jgi:hypothetical protein
MLPDLNERGDLPPGIHTATWREVEQRFGTRTERRVRAMAILRLLFDLALRTGHLRSFFVFGSFVSAKAEPRDVDVLLIMSRDFRIEECASELQPLFFHLQAAARYGASVFWFREATWSNQFLLAWQLKRDGTVRGIVEVA